MIRRRACVSLACLAAGLLLLPAAVRAQHTVKNLEVRVLSTMLTGNQGIGEWGFAALVEADGRRILFDTGARPETVLKNLGELSLDLNGITDVILSHNHGDHTGGLIPLRRHFPQSLKRAHVGKGIFLSRPRSGAGEGNPMIATKGEYEKSGGVFTVHDAFTEIYPGIWLTGPVPRKYPERNWSGAGKLRNADGAEAEDNLPEDMSMVVATSKGLVLISGCGHAGIINTLEHVRTKLGTTSRLHAALGGFHLFPASDKDLDWTAGKLKEFGIENFVGAHCTGIEATYRIRERAGLTRKTCVVGAVGTRFSLRDGVVAGAIAQ